MPFSLDLIRTVPARSIGLSSCYCHFFSVTVLQRSTSLFRQQQSRSLSFWNNARIVQNTTRLRLSSTATRDLNFRTEISRRTLSTMTFPARRFAPLDSAQVVGDKADLQKLKVVVFDVDGTLCLPQSWMFAEMRRVLGITKKTDILDHVLALPTDIPDTHTPSDLPIPENIEPLDAATTSAQSLGYAKLRAVERLAMSSMAPQEGLVTLMDYLDSRSIRKAICTRNFDAPVNHLISNFITGHLFHPIITRDYKPPKPDPAGILYIGRELGVAREEVIMVGDSMDDMLAGRRAGAATVLLVNKENAELKESEFTDFWVERLDELVGVLEAGFVGREI